jgi:hypothetical protein
MTVESDFQVGIDLSLFSGPLFACSATGENQSVRLSPAARIVEAVGEFVRAVR